MSKNFQFVKNARKVKFFIVHLKQKKQTFVFSTMAERREQPN
jgi:hypothetical protein